MDAVVAQRLRHADARRKRQEPAEQIGAGPGAPAVLTCRTRAPRSAAAAS
jgi:hypothetical protein